jgi:protein-L-isoaspartate(D-aspartate) O-methyltransferase
MRLSKGIEPRTRPGSARALFFLALVLILMVGVMVEPDPFDNGNDQFEEEEDRYAALREKMVREQIMRRGVTDSLVLAAMKRVPRHEFVPEFLRESAYEDTPLPIGEGQTISQPYIVALMTASLELKGGEKVLEVGTGSGYQAAILAEIADSVYSIEIKESLARGAAERLKRLGYKNVFVRHGDGYFGWPDAAPFDAIIVAAAPEEVPEPLVEQLKEGGRMVIPVGDWDQELLKIRKLEGGKLQKEYIVPVRFVPMTGEAEKRKGKEKP